MGDYLERRIRPTSQSPEQQKLRQEPKLEQKLLLEKIIKSTH
jgi:hypothetical protein